MSDSRMASVTAHAMLVPPKSPRIVPSAITIASSARLLRASMPTWILTSCAAFSDTATLAGSSEMNGRGMIPTPTSLHDSSRIALMLMPYELLNEKTTPATLYPRSCQNAQTARHMPLSVGMVRPK